MTYTISVIVPVFNEKQRIKQSLQQLADLRALCDIAQFVVVDDGSTDGTSDILAQLPVFQKDNFILVTLDKNYGKGYAIRRGLEHVTGQYTIIHDADLEYDPNDILTMLAHAQKNNISVLYGSRNMKRTNKQGGFLFYWGGRCLSWLTNILYRQNLTDEATCYKLFETHIIQQFPLTCQRFEFCPEVTALSAKAGIRIKEVPISYTPRSMEEGKKISLWDGVEACWELVRLRVTFGHFGVAAVISLFVFSVYFFTWPSFFMGYEQETAQSALSLLSGDYEIRRAGIGAALLYLPWAIVGKLLFSNADRVLQFMTLAPVFYSACAMGLLYLLFVRMYTHRIAYVSTLLVAFGSLVWPYSKIGMEYQLMVWLIILLWSLICLRSAQFSNKQIHWVGVSLFCLTMTKSYGLVFLLPTILYVATCMWGEWSAVWKNVRVIILYWLSAIVLLFGINVFFYHQLTGIYSFANEFQIWTWWEGLYGIFFSFGKSIFLYSPVLIVAVVYWKRFLRDHLAEGVFILVSFGLLFLITAPFSYWTDETLSVRKLVPVIPLLHLPIGYALLNFVEWGKIRKVCVYVFIGLCLYIQCINSLYPYWEQLNITRSYGVNTLSALRYSPQLSHMVINHNLFLSFVRQRLHIAPKPFVFVENTWMTYTHPERTILNINQDLSSMNEPQIFFFNTQKIGNKIAFLLIQMVLFPVSSLLLYCNWKKNNA